jgi:hypothetical protein
MSQLRKAVALGYRSLHAYRTDGGLDQLRDRDDFKILMMDVAMPAEAFAAAR